MTLKKLLKGPLPLAAGLVMLLILGLMLFNPNAYQTVTTDKGLELLNDQKVKEVVIVDGENRVDMVLKKADEKLGERVQFRFVTARSLDVIAAVNDADPSDGFNDEIPAGSGWISLLLYLLVPVLIIGFFFWMMSSARSGENRMMQFGKSRAMLANKDTPQVTFADVAGADEAIDELGEIKDFLKDPEKFQALGAKIPKGVLLYGPPGTGKTLLARAVAGEANVAFFSISGSDFVEMFVGVGASRVRDLFKQAKQNAPAIIFVDEIDAVGRHRGAGMGGGHDEREQTLNQLLVEMDGFDQKTNIILIAATNRPDILDPALLRPGRFDRQIPVDAPDLKGRKKILEVHSLNKPIADDVDLEVVARRTPGFTGADLSNVLNEAALLTARRDKNIIGQSEVDEAIDRVIGGPQRRTRVMSDHERLVTAYHEGGHAVVAAAMNHTDPVTKVTILPRGRALGYTMVMPLEDRYSVTRNQLLDQLAYAMGGRVAEELIFHDPSTGASNDIEKATSTARKMVTEYGMTSALGTVKFGSGSGEVFLGRDMGHERDYSDEKAREIDVEVQKLLDVANTEAWEALTKNRAVLDELAERLLIEETLNHLELDELFTKIVKMPAREQWLSHPDRPVSDIPPVKVPERLSAETGSIASGESAANGTADEASVSTEPTEPTEPSDEGSASETGDNV